jgi:hypothetical protein
MGRSFMMIGMIYWRNWRIRALMWRIAGNDWVFNIILGNCGGIWLHLVHKFFILLLINYLFNIY